MQRDRGEVVDRFRDRLMVPIAATPARSSRSADARWRRTRAAEVPRIRPRRPFTRRAGRCTACTSRSRRSGRRTTRCSSRAISTSRRCCQHGIGAGRRLVRHGAQRAAGAAAAAVHVEGRAQLRSRRRRRGRRGAVVRAARGGRIQRERRAAAQGTGSGYVRPDGPADGYQERLRQSQPYLDFLLDRAAAAPRPREPTRAGGRSFKRCSASPPAFRTPPRGTSLPIGWPTKHELLKT